MLNEVCFFDCITLEQNAQKQVLLLSALRYLTLIFNLWQSLRFHKLGTLDLKVVKQHKHKPDSCIVVLWQVYPSFL